MARNKKLELDSNVRGQWFTADGRFAVVRRNKPINPMEATVDFKISPEYSIHSFEDYDGPKEFPTLAPTVGVVPSFKEAFPWLGKYTGEGSFELGGPDRATAKPLGGSRKVVEAKGLLADVFVGEMLVEDEWGFNLKWLAGVKKWWKQWVKKADQFSKGRGELAGDRVLDYLDDGISRLTLFKEHLWLNKGLWPRDVTGQEKADRAADRFGLSKNNIAWDLAHALTVLEKKKISMGHLMDVTYGQMPDWKRAASTYILDKSYGKQGNLTGFDAGIEALADDVKEVDSYVSGKVFRRLNAFVKKFNPLGDQSDPYENDGAPLEFSVGKMKVMFQPIAGGSSQHMIRNIAKGPAHARNPVVQKFYVNALDRAEKMLRRAGFGKSWYGVTWIVPKSEAGEVSGVLSGKTYSVGAHWTYSDNIVIFSDARRSVLDKLARLIVHEIGHRWYFKFMNQRERLAFNSYFGDVSAVSGYGSEHPQEDFAEVFSWYVTGEKLTRDQRERFKEFALKRGTIKRHEDVVQMRDELVG